MLDGLVKQYGHIGPPPGPDDRFSILVTGKRPKSNGARGTTSPVTLENYESQRFRD